MHLELTHGSAEIRDAATVTRKERNDLLERMPSAPQTIGPDGKLRQGEIDFKTGMAGTDEIIAFVVTSWTLGPLPSDDRTVLDGISAIDADRIEEAAKNFMTALMPSTDSTPTGPPSTT